MNDDLGPISEREIEVLRLVAEGKTNQQIARALVISPNTVKVHLRNIFEKLGVQSRTEATMEAVRRGWVGVNGVALPGAVAGSGAAPAAETSVALSPAETPAETPTVEPAAAPALPPAPVEPIIEHAPIALWQRVYMVAAALLIILGLLAPGWWQSRSQAARLTPFSDAGRPQTAAAPRGQVTRWLARAPLPEPRSRMAVATDGTRLYVIGGETGGALTDQVTIYDPRSNGWQTAAGKPTAVANAAALWLAGRVFVPGGALASGAATNAVEVYDPQTDTWSARAPLPFPLAAYGAAALDGKLYLFGGWDGAQNRADTLIYDPTSDSWTTGTALAEPRAFLAASALGGLIYVAGGFDGEREVATVAAYNPAGEGAAAGPWSPRSPLSQSRGGLGLVGLGARLYAIGGGWTEALTFNEQYDTRTDAWSRIETPIVGQWRNLGAVALGNKVYAIGGWGGSYLGNNEEYQALLQQLLPLFTKGQ
ncbi:MAG: luxR-type protein [Chloroflexota bacterium]|nr:luxR-type protein [Chloroflexota bacterium]